MDKKIIYFVLGIFGIVVAVVMYFIFFGCSDHRIVSCCHQGDKEYREKIKNISCSSNNDCSVESMVSHCSPDCPNLFYRSYGKYYCGDDGYCHGCNAFIDQGNDWFIFLPKECN